MMERKLTVKITDIRLSFDFFNSVMLWSVILPDGSSTSTEELRRLLALLCSESSSSGEKLSEILFIIELRNILSCVLCRDSEDLIITYV